MRAGDGVWMVVLAVSSSALVLGEIAYGAWLVGRLSGGMAVNGANAGGGADREVTVAIGIGIGIAAPLRSSESPSRKSDEDEKRLP